MTGLVWVDTLQLTVAQSVAVGLASGVWLLLYVTYPDRLPTFGGAWACALLWIAFWNVPTSLDTRLLFQSCQALQGEAWSDLLSALAFKPYVSYQTPFYTYYLAQAPDIWRHQVYLFPWTLLCIELMTCLYGRHAALLCGTPVFALMMHQPCHDVLLFGVLLIALRCCQMGQRVIGAAVYGLCWCCKPLVVLTLPLMLPRLGLAGLGSVGCWIGYYCWSRQWYFGHKQQTFLLRQTLISSRHRRTHPVRWLWRRLQRRWGKIGRYSLRALPVYLFPAWLRPWTWQGMGLGLVILAGYGNVKYFLLDLLFLFPVKEGLS